MKFRLTVVSKSEKLPLHTVDAAAVVGCAVAAAAVGELPSNLARHTDKLELVAAAGAAEVVDHKRKVAQHRRLALAPELELQELKLELVQLQLVQVPLLQEAAAAEGPKWQELEGAVAVEHIAAAVVAAAVVDSIADIPSESGSTGDRWLDPCTDTARTLLRRHCTVAVRRAGR